MEERKIIKINVKEPLYPITYSTAHGALFLTWKYNNSLSLHPLSRYLCIDLGKESSVGMHAIGIIIVKGKYFYCAQNVFLHSSFFHCSSRTCASGVETR